MKRPTIKDTNRAYVRLYDYVIKHLDWAEFKSKYQVQIISHGMQKYGDCGIQVIGSDGFLARLGPDIPNKITYTDFPHPKRITWVDYFCDEQTCWSKTHSY